MPRYFFHIEGSRTLRVGEGAQELVDDGSALAEAEAIAENIAKERPEYNGCLVVARSEDGILAGRAEICVEPCDLDRARRLALHNKA